MSTVTPPSYVYETPDGGVTVYRREMGKLDRQLIEVHPTNLLGEWGNRRALAVKRMRLYRIAADSEHDAVLNDMLERVEVYWALKHGGSDGA